jgi:hypothetical protein
VVTGRKILTRLFRSSDSIDQENDMHPRNIGGLLTALAFGLAIGVPATAAADPATATASASNFNYTLIDLTPDDGKTPWVSLAPWGASETTVIYGDTMSSGGTAAQNNHFDYGKAQAQAGSDVASGSVQPGQAQASIAISDRSGEAYAKDEYLFTLSPNTRLVFSAYATVDTAMDRISNPATAIAGLGGQQYGVYPNGDLIGTLRLVERPGSQAGWVEVDVESGAGGTSGYIDVYALARVSNVSPVPEPSPALLLLAGLPLLAGAFVSARKPILSELPPSCYQHPSPPPAALSARPRCPSAPAASA